MKHLGVRRLRPDSDGLAILTPQSCRTINEDVKNLINQLGMASSKAQGLSHIITTFNSFMGGDNKI